jgi:hypothetical protein
MSFFRTLFSTFVVLLYLLEAEYKSVIFHPGWYIYIYFMVITDTILLTSVILLGDFMLPSNSVSLFALHCLPSVPMLYLFLH